MGVASVRPLVLGAVLPATALALVLAVSGCKGGQATLSAQGASPTGPVPGAASAAAGIASAPAPASDPPAATATSQDPAPGSLSVSVTSPVPLSGTATKAVSCATGLTYHAQASGAVIHGDQVSYTVAVARYRGPGTYPAVVAVTLRQSTGVVTTVAGVSKVPATITSSGGSFSVSATGSGGRTFSGSLTWTCGT